MTAAAYLTWHLRQAWAPLTYTDEEPPAQADPVLTDPTSRQREAFSLIGAAIPLTLRK